MLIRALRFAMIVVNMQAVSTQSDVPTYPVSTKLRVRRVTQARELAALRGPWNRLAGGASMRSWDWLEAWWRHYGNGSNLGATRRRELYVLTVYDDTQALVGLAPCYLERGRLGACNLRMLGDGEICSEYLSVLARPGAESEVATALADWLTNQGRGDWGAIALDCVDAQDVALERFCHSLVGQGCLIHRRFVGNCWRIALPESWESFLALLSRSKRKALRQAHRRFFETGRAIWHTVYDQNDFERAWLILIALHQRRRRSLGDAGMFASRRFAAFHREVALRFLECGALELHWLELDGRPVAAEYNFTGRGLVYSYQSGVDPSALAFEPGRLAMIAVIQDAITKGHQCFDFLRGDEPYKAWWNAKPTPLVNIHIASPRVTSRWRHSVWLAKEGCLGWIKRRSAARAACGALARLAEGSRWYRARGRARRSRKTSLDSNTLPATPGRGSYGSSRMNEEKQR